MGEHKPLFDVDDQARASEPCPLCQSPLKVKHIGNNSFLGCSAYPACSYTRSLHEEASFTPEPLADSFCPKCDAQLLLKKGRYGFFIGCSAFPACDYIADPEPESTQPLCACPACKRGELVERANKFGKTFYACNRYPKCKFALNHKPHDTACPQCSYPVLIEKSSSAGPRLCCPQKSCSYRSKPL